MKLNFKEIVEGWRNHLVPPKDMKDVIEKVSEERLEICKACPWQSDNAAMLGKKTYRPDLHCTNCGCTLVAKTKSLSSKCPLGKWESIITDAERFELDKQIKEDETSGLQTRVNQSSEGTSKNVSDSETN